MVNWTPITLDEPQDQMAASQSKMDAALLQLWNTIRIPPVKWQLHPWGDEGNGFWVVGVIGCQVVWYNDIEDGFNVSSYSIPGIVDEYWCNQDLLAYAVNRIRLQLEGQPLGYKLGPPTILSPDESR